MHIIPALDIIEHKVVRLTEGKYDTQQNYAVNPLDFALHWQSLGGKFLHMVDLEGAKGVGPINASSIIHVAQHTNLHIDVGGGIRSSEHIIQYLNAGVKQVNVGSMAYKNPALLTEWIQKFGSESIILSMDVHNECIAVQGWLEQTNMHWREFLKTWVHQGIQYVVCTDISKDGRLQGPSFDLYAHILQAFPNIKLIASGGIASIQDVDQLANQGLYGAIIGKAILEGHISWNQLQARC